MKRNPHGGDSNIVEIAALGVGLWFLFRNPGNGQASLFTQLTGAVGGSGAGMNPTGAGVLTVPVGTPVPAGYKITGYTATGQQVMAPIPPGQSGYSPQVYAAAGAAGGIVGSLTGIVQAIGKLFSGGGGGVATGTGDTGTSYSAVGANGALSNATAMQDYNGNIVGYYVTNPDGTTTMWNAAGQNPTVTDPSGVVVVATDPIPDLTVNYDPTIGSGWDGYGSQPDPLVMDIWAPAES